MASPVFTCACEGRHFEPALHYTSPPAGETLIASIDPASYDRSYWQCRLCQHFIARTNLDIADIYDGDYARSTYGSRMAQVFDRIIALPPEKSDNAGRVAAIRTYATQHFGEGFRPALLDVGSGLGVFPFAIEKLGWDCTALDPDGGAVAHMRSRLAGTVIHGDMRTATDLGLYDIITFNKVLEHLEDPVAVLASAVRFLEPGGFIYVELPDGEMAINEGQGREEFFLEHLHVFSFASLALLATAAGLKAQAISRLREPSTKYTLRSFLVRG